jgi:group I intron endonuclease
MKSGIYTITNAQNGRVYVGSSVDINARWYKHRRDLNFNRHHSPKLQADWNECGADAFQFSVALVVNELHDLIKQEQSYIDFHDASNGGYNVRHVASGNPIRNRKRTDEQRKADKREYCKKYAHRKRMEKKEADLRLWASPAYQQQMLEKEQELREKEQAIILEKEIQLAKEKLSLRELRWPDKFYGFYCHRCKRLCDINPRMQAEGHSYCPLCGGRTLTHLRKTVKSFTCKTCNQITHVRLICDGMIHCPCGGIFGTTRLRCIGAIGQNVTRFRSQP